MITADSLREYLGSPAADDEFLEGCIQTAANLVNIYIGTAAVPEAVLDNVYMSVSADIYMRRNAPQGISQFASFDGAAIRIARDPLQGAYPIINRYVGAGV